MGPAARKLRENVVLSCGWGRLVFAHTFRDSRQLADTLLREVPGQRDIALYLRDPHVVLAMAPDRLFLDPSHTYRLWMSNYRPSRQHPRGYLIRPVRRRSEADAMNRIYAARRMVPADTELVWDRRNSRALNHLVAVDLRTKRVIGTVTGVDHRRAFEDPENGSSLWCLAVDPQAPYPGVGEMLVRHLAEYFQARGRTFMDLSVMHDNKQAIALYEKLGFRRVPVFCVKTKNPINEPLYTAPAPKSRMNPYAEVIVREARRRGISVEVLEPKKAVFRLTFGGRSILCRESLSDVTSAVAMTICDDKSLTHLWLRRAGLNVTLQRPAGAQKDNEAFLKRHKRLVVKPARGEQGAGITVDVSTRRELDEAVAAAALKCREVLLEKYVADWQDLRIVVINYKVVAAAVRRPPQIQGTGEHTVRQLIEKLSRRRAAATGGESRIPFDAETERCVRAAGHRLDGVLAAGKVLAVRKTANVHTGGTIHDVTESLHPRLAAVAERAARALGIPVVGFDFLVPRVDGRRYVIVEANERVGLANHEPQPTAQRFLDLLFPQSAAGQLEKEAA